MVIVQLLKRRDPSSIIIAIFVAYGLLQLIGALTSQPTTEIMRLFGAEANQFGYGEADWKTNYLAPLVTFALQVIALELITRAYIFVAGYNRTTARPVAKKRK